jgi:hypothetical protein
LKYKMRHTILLLAGLILTPGIRWDREAAWAVAFCCA